MIKFTRCVLVGVALALYCPLAQASVQVDIGPNGPTGNHWGLGTGWGTGDGQLDAKFSVSSKLPDVSFLLDLKESYKFKFGKIELCEKKITSDETDNLEVTGYLYFDSPAIGSVGIPGEAIAFTGKSYCWNDSKGDWEKGWGKKGDYYKKDKYSHDKLKIKFDPVYVEFDTCGKLKIELSDVCFDKKDKTQYVYACVKLVKECPPPPPGIPEPTTIVIWSLLGGVGLVVAWRKRKTAS